MSKIVVITFTGIGNMIMFLPALERIKKKYSNVQMDLVYMNKGVKNVVERKHIFDNYYHISKNPFSFLKLLIHVLKEKYTVSINGLFSSKNVLALIPFFGLVDYRVGFVDSPDYKNRFSFVYNCPVSMKKDQHEINRRMELALVIYPRLEHERIKRKPKLNLSNEEKKFANKFFKDNNISKDDTVISVSVGCNIQHRWKQWGTYKYCQLCDMLMRKGYKVIFNGSTDELSLINDIEKKMRYDPIVSAGKTKTVGEAASIIEKSDVSVTNDSGLMHVSYAVDTPVVAIFGPTDVKRAGPINEKDVVVRKDIDCSPCYNLSKKKKCTRKYLCLRSISVSDVFVEVMKTIGE